MPKSGAHVLLGNLFPLARRRNQKRLAEKLDKVVEKTLQKFVHKFELSPEVANIGKNIVSDILKTFAEDHRALSLLIKMSSHGSYLFKHSLETAFVSLLIAKSTQNHQASTKMIQICGFGGLLHDVGMLKIPVEIIETPSLLSEDAWKKLRQHPKYGLDLLDGLKEVPDEVRHIVFQHHEEPGASGYPGKLPDSVIFFPAKIVAVADSFCVLITKRPFREAFTTEQALGILQHEPRKYDQSIVQALERSIIKMKNIAA